MIFFAALVHDGASSYSLLWSSSLRRKLSCNSVCDCKVIFLESKSNWRTVKSCNAKLTQKVHLF